jgi:hypothetical protein
MVLGVVKRIGAALGPVGCVDGGQVVCRGLSVPGDGYQCRIKGSRGRYPERRDGCSARHEHHLPLGSLLR